MTAEPMADTGKRQNQRPMPKVEIVNGLRGVAILAVVWQHLFGQYFKLGSPVALDAAAGPGFYLSYGWIGVQLFFVLSGFVLYLPYAEGRVALDFAGFYRRRAARLLPLYYIVAALCLVLNQPVPEGTKFLAELASMGLVLFPFVNHGFEPYLNPPLWSLGVEIWFSALFPFVVLALRRYGVVPLLVATTLIGCVSRAAGIATGLLPLSTGLTANLEVFGAGMALAGWYAAGNRLTRPRLAAGAGALVVLAAIWAKQAALPGAAVLFFDALTIGLALVLAGLLSLESGLLRAAFANRPIQVIGMMCFSFYAWHEPLLRHVFQADLAPLAGLGGTLPVYLVSLAVIGALSYRFIEFGRVADWRTLFLLSPAWNLRLSRGFQTVRSASGRPERRPS
jgi:peptidoglycan/LPS O-acetylase OafA/YrhL